MDGTERAVLLIAESCNNADMYHAIRFLFSDPVIYLRHHGRELLVCSNFEREEAQRHSRVAEVADFEAFGYTKLLKQFPKRYEAFAALVLQLLHDRSVGSVIVTSAAPVDVVDYLRAQGIEVICDPEALLGARIAKRDDEIVAMEVAQRATERAMRRAIDLVGASEVRDGQLLLEGQPLTAEHLRAAIDGSFLADNCLADGTIAACGPLAAGPHYRGAGLLHPNQTIILDIFPRHKEHRYFADMTRTISKGDPGPELRRMYDTTLRAQEAALALIRPGISGREVYEAVCSIYEDADYPTTLRTGGAYPATGFIHSLGHGLGLEVHERPNMGRQDETLEVGHVVTVEPGLYDPKIGAVRIEDMVVVTEHGCRNLTQFEKRLIV